MRERHMRSVKQPSPPSRMGRPHLEASAIRQRPLTQGLGLAWTAPEGVAATHNRLIGRVPAVGAIDGALPNRRLARIQFVAIR